MFLLWPSILPWALHLAMASRRGRLRERPVIAVAGVGVGVDAADFDSSLRSGLLLGVLQRVGSRRSALHVERRRGVLRSTGRGSASTTRLVASNNPGIELERQRDACFEAVCHRSRRSFRPLCAPMAEPATLTHTTRLDIQSLRWLCASIRTKRACS